MNLRAVSAILALLSGLASARAADIEGDVVIKRKLTKRKVTLSVSPYERGVAVKLDSGPSIDPLAFERTHVVIYLEGQLPPKSVTGTIEQKNRQFFPDMLVISTGSSVSFPNLDPIFHNVFSLSKPKSFDLGNYPKDQTRNVTFPKPGVVFVNCRLHPNMTAAIVVTPNEWNTRARADGKFTLSNVPPGRYTVIAWHKAAGFFRHVVDVTENRGATVQFIIPIGESGAAVSQR